MRSSATPSSSSAARTRDVPPFSRAQRLLLALILLAGLGRGLFWVATIAVWNPVDEMQHYGYVASIANGAGIPVVGRDLLPAEALLLAKDSTTYGFRPSAVTPSPSDPAWGTSAHQYEGVQPPLYYVLLAPVYLLVKPTGLLSTVIALRVVTLLISLVAVPLTALLARELFPTRRVVPVAAAGLLVTLGAVNAYGAYVTNDALVLPLSAGLLLVCARAWRGGLTLPQAAAAGVLAGLLFLTRVNAVVLGPLVLAALIAAGVRHRAGAGRVVAWGALAAVIAAVIGAPWIAWTRLAYPGTSVTAEFTRLIGPIVGIQPRTLSGVREHLEDASRGWFDFEVLRPPLGAFFWGSLAVCGIATFAGLAAAWRRRDGAAALALLWLAASGPVAIVGMFAVIQLVLAGSGGMVGRYLILTLPPLAVLVAAGLDLALGARWGALAVAVVAAAAVTGGARLDRTYVDFVYTQPATAEVAPVVDQSWNDGFVALDAVSVRPPCPVRAVTLTFAGAAPASVGVAGTQVPASETAHVFGDAEAATYRLPRPQSQPFDVTLPPGTQIGVSASERAGALSLPGQAGDPVARLDCPVGDPDATRFAQLHELADVVPVVRYGTLMALPIAWAVTAWIVVAAVALLGGRLREPVSRPVTAATPPARAASSAPSKPG